MKRFLALRGDALLHLAEAARGAVARGNCLDHGWVHAAVGRAVSPDHAQSVTAEMLRLLSGGMLPAHLAELLDTLAIAQDSRATVEDRTDLVWTGPEGAGTASRDTAVVVREAFGRAESSVLVAGYVIYRGQKVFASLARRMTERPDLRVRFFLNVERGRGDTSIASEIVRRFARRFREEQWPGSRLPEVFYDPRALELEAGRRAVLHAKCIVIDGVTAFVSSANFTPAAQVKNIEAGALIRSPSFAASLEGHFESLVDEGVLVRVLSWNKWEDETWPRPSCPHCAGGCLRGAGPGEPFGEAAAFALALVTLLSRRLRRLAGPIAVSWAARKARCRVVPPAARPARPGPWIRNPPGGGRLPQKDRRPPPGWTTTAGARRPALRPELPGLSVAKRSSTR